MAARPIHPWPLRLMHWLNALALVIMIGSGWQIYDAHQLFRFAIPPSVTIGEWLAGAIAWHFAAMWLFVLNGLAYLAWGTVSGHFRRRFLPLSPRAVLRDLWLAATFRLPHRPGRYNAVQRLLYLGVLACGTLSVVTGLAFWKPVQLWWLSDLLGGFRETRFLHFAAMSGIVAFLAVHLVLVAAVPKVLAPMITGGPGRWAGFGRAGESEIV
ncbi:MAG: cytochrome b/b6 domain-containing protein [Acetobacteraceae bacterium]